MALKTLLTALCTLVISFTCIAGDWDNRRWDAFQIVPEPEHRSGYGVFHFRKEIDLPAKPDSFVVMVSADQRYRLFVNGHTVALGPARGDLFHWKYETVNIAPYLTPGLNMVAVVVWNHGIYTPEPQITSGNTHFVLQGKHKEAELLNTDTTWQYLENEAYTPIKITGQDVPFYYVAGPGELIDAARYPWGWETGKDEGFAWKNAQRGHRAAPFKINDSGQHMLVPSDIPAMELKNERLAEVRSSTLPGISKEFPKNRGVSITIPAHRTDTLLLDQGHLTTAYPELNVSGGKNAKITLKYAEGLYLPHQRLEYKENRNEINGKVFTGYYDSFVSDGGINRNYKPLWWRTWRYIQVIIETKEQPLVINSISGEFTAYPFEEKSTFASDQAWINKLIPVGIRTARLCANETYMDCPYYEQLQYAGDTRIQCIMAYYNFGDDRLAKQAIRALYNSRRPEGFTASRYPTKLFQIIPTYSLYWIGMLYDYHMYRPDTGFVKEMLPGTRTVMDFFKNYTRSDGALANVPWWNFIDWSAKFNRGVPPSGADGLSAHFDLLRLHALQMLIPLEEAYGSKTLAAGYREEEVLLKATIRNLYYDKAKGLFADVTEKNRFSQHVNAMAILTDVALPGEYAGIIEKTFSDSTLAQCTIYFKYYLYMAAVKAGKGNDYLSYMDEWNTQLKMGLSTWAEEPEPSRSDCHAWGCSPNIELYRTVLGIDTDAPGFARVKIKPHLGTLQSASGTIPHPAGSISVKYTMNKKKKWTAEITLPEGISGTLEWAGYTYGFELTAGYQKITL